MIAAARKYRTAFIVHEDVVCLVFVLSFDRMCSNYVWPDMTGSPGTFPN